MTAPAQERACYVYGVVREPHDEALSAVGELPAVGSPDSRVDFVPHGGIAAAVSDVPVTRALGTPDDLQAHARVLDTLGALRAPVLPFRFGTVVGDVQAVSDELLANGHDDFTAALDRLEGLAQFTLKARYVQDEVVREVLEEQPDVQRLRAEVEGVEESASYYQRIELGRLISEAMTAKRATDSAEAERRLAPLAVATATAEAASPEGVVNASFLVEYERRGDFEQAADDLAREWYGRIRVRLLGPLAPYDFVSDALSGDKEGGW